MASDESGSAEEELFPILDAYLNGLHQQGPLDRNSIVAAHPELARVLDCLDALDSLAPRPSELRSGLHGEHGADHTPGPSAAKLRLGQDDQDRASTDAIDFGKYELLGEIGRGGMGVVFKARQKDLDRTVALKMIQASHLASREQVRRFLAEARAAARLQHPHIVRIFEAGQLHDQHYFAMEYVAGASLAERLKEGPLPADDAARCVSAVAQAVDHLHRQGIVHRDLKPSNILLDGNGRPYVTDFGLAKMFGPDSATTHSGAIMGTPSYMSPEQAAGKTSQVGPLSDVYSLGGILYELLTGRPAFREDTPLDTLVQVLEAEPPPPRRLNPAIPRALESICLRCLERSPEQRYPSAAALAEDLDRYLAGEEVEGLPSGVSRRLLRWARREPALASHLAGLAAFFGIEMANYHVAGVVDVAFHRKMIAVLAVWVLASVLLQRLLRRPALANLARFVWAGTDVVLLTVALLIADGVASPMVIGFPLLIAGSGLWFRERLVWFVTAASLLSYGVLIVESYGRPPESQRLYYHHLIFCAALALIGVAVAFQVHRVRALSRYYEHRPLL